LLKGIDELRAFVDIAAASLEGETFAARRQWPQAIASLTRAVELEDALESEEPPPWAMSTRVELGAVLLRAGRARAAEQIAREDLARFPDNGWALAVLEASLRRQGRAPQAEAVRARLDQAWRAADVPRSQLERN
jgi:tetratricopeptide (TPR) repeat protein